MAETANSPLSGFFGTFMFDEKGRLTFLFPISMRMNELKGQEGTDKQERVRA